MKGKIVIAGGTGFLGQSIIETFRQDPEVSIVVLSRTPQNSHDGVRYLLWDARSAGIWQKELEGATAIINLVGKSVNCRYTPSNREAIIDSRVNATRIIGKTIAGSADPPKVWINMSSAAIYGDGGAEWKSEHSSAGTGFPVEVCERWEKAFFAEPLPATRKIALRAGLVFQRKRGLLMPFVNLARKGLGGTIGSGNQYVSWIHERDFLRLILAMIDDDSYQGIYNCSSPEPVTNRSFMRAIRKELGMPFGLSTPSFLVRLGAAFVPTEAELILNGRRVFSQRLKESSFAFEFPGIKSALADLLHHQP